jgi:hypothetical protein
VGPSQRTCRHCDTTNFVAECDNCRRPFALTGAHVSGRAREFDDGPLTELPTDFEVPHCDFCSAKEAGEPPTVTTNAGARQKTCPICHTEFFSESS